jgi:hypothetical protein
MVKKKSISYGNDNYKEQLAQFMQEINPKPDKEVLEKILEKIKADQVKNSVQIDN